MVRYSRESDEEGIRQLFNECFCYDAFAEKNKNYNPFVGINGRYLVYEVEGKIVAMTGLYKTSSYGALEMDWTCTYPAYRRLGLMHELFKRLIDSTDEDIYCSCWRFKGKDNVNLQALMDDFGFKCVMPVCKHRVGKYDCKHRRGRLDYDGDINECECFEDLYLRECTKI